MTCSTYLVRATLAFSEIFFGHWCYFYWSSRMFVFDLIFLRNYTHLHCSILISFTSSLFSWLSLLAMSLLHRVCRPTPNVGLTTVMYLRPFLSHNTPLDFFQFPLCYTHSYVLISISISPFSRCPQVGEVVIHFNASLLFPLFVYLLYPLVRNYIPSTVFLVYWLYFPSLPVLLSVSLDILSYQLNCLHT